MEQRVALNAQHKPELRLAYSTCQRHLIYFISMLAILAVLIAVPLVAIRLSFYPRYSNYFYDPVIDYKASLKDKREDVVVYGDSSALHNVVPSVIAKRTDLQVYNLGFTASVVGGAPDLMLDRYLSHNALPHIIVLYISPPTIVNGYDLDGGHFYEAAMVLERYASIADAIKFYIANPRRAFAVAAVVFRNLLTPPEPTQRNFREVSEALSAQSGWVATPDLFKGGVGLLPAQNNQARHGFTADAKYIEDFKRKYEALGAKVLVYVSPISTCSDLPLDEVKAAYRSLADSEPYVLPCAYFRGGFHLVQSGAEQNSERVADFLVSKLDLKRAAQP